MRTPREGVESTAPQASGPRESGQGRNRFSGRSVRLKALVAGGLVVGTAVVGMTPAPAAVGSFDGSAQAAGARMIWFADKGPATKTPIDGGGPVAMAGLDSLGSSSALASNPYPGDVFLAGPGLAAGAFGAPSLPGYPFIARADYPVTPQQSASTPFGDFNATAAPDAAAATATTGGGSGDYQIGRAVSRAGVKALADTVVSEAQSTAEAIQLGALHIGGVHASAKVVLRPDGTLERTADVGFDNATVAGTPVVFTPTGVVPAPGVSAPAGPTPAQELAATGIDVVQLSKENTADGIVSGGLQITKKQDFGPAGPGYIRVVFGQASARARGEATVLTPPAGSSTSAASSASAPASPASAGLVPGPIAGTPAASSPVFDAAPSSRPASAARSAEVGADASPAGASVPPVAAVTGLAAAPAGGELVAAPAAAATFRTVAAAQSPMRARLAVAGSNRLDTTPVYAALVFAVALAAAATQLIRRIGER